LKTKPGSYRDVDLVLDVCRRSLLEHLLHLLLGDGLVELLRGANCVGRDLIELNAKLEAKLIELVVGYNTISAANGGAS
jgi:hypothetical protein